MILDDLRIGADAPIGLDEFRLQSQPFRHDLPQRRKLAGLDHEHAIAGRQRIGQRRFPGAGAGRREHDHRLRGLEDGLDAFEHAPGELDEFRAALVDERHVDRAQHAVGHGRRSGDLQEMTSGKTRCVLRHFSTLLRTFSAEHDLFGKPVSTLPAHAQNAGGTGPKAPRRRLDPRMLHSGQVVYPPQALIWCGLVPPPRPARRWANYWA
jgi:hypothetical protein